jgi:hypothetical protein
MAEPTKPARRTAAKPDPDGQRDQPYPPDAAPGAWIDPGRPWQLLKEPFPEDQLELKPQPVSRQDQDKGRCEAGTRYTADGMVCGGWHTRSVHLTYVGHAGITDRLNDVCGPEGWELEPLALGQDGLPVIRGGQLWVKLTIWGVTKIEVGDADGRSGYEEGKVIWSDALKRAAMRFGIGTYLWSKSDKAKALVERSDPDPAPKQAERSRQQSTEGEDPWKVEPLTEEGMKLLADALAMNDDEEIRRLLVKVKGMRLQHVTPKQLGVEIAPHLRIEGPMPLFNTIERISQFVEHFRISPIEHVERLAQKKAEGAKS